jgi:hypothetical protein
MLKSGRSGRNPKLKAPERGANVQRPMPNTELNREASIPSAIPFTDKYELRRRSQRGIGQGRCYQTGRFVLRNVTSTELRGSRFDVGLT